MSGRDPRKLLRWYPPDWRRRYGEELLALLEDETADQPLTVGRSAAVAVAGLRQRWSAALGGWDGSPAAQARAGSLLVLCGWTVLVLGGIAFQRVSEHFASAVSPSAREGAQAAFDAVVVLAVVGSVLVATAAVVALPTWVASLRHDGVGPLARPVITALVLTTVGLAAGEVLVQWGHRLSDVQRNGGNTAYSVTALFLAALTAAVLGQWTRVAVIVARRLRLSTRTLLIEARLAQALAAAMGLIVLAAGVWWAVMAAAAPSFLVGGSPAHHGPPLPPDLAASAAFMLGGALLGALGARRAIAGRHRLAASSTDEASPAGNERLDSEPS
jgi:hypothetical protein